MMGMGLIFGIFHLDPYRFLGTALLGVFLTLIMLETRNILLPMLFHFVNNSVASLSTLLNEPGAAVQPPLSSVGIFLILAAAVPFLLLASSRLLKAKAESSSNSAGKRVKFIAIAAAVMLAAAGTGITSAYFAREPVFESSFSGEVNRYTPPHELEFTVLKDGSYFIDLSIQGDRVVTSMVIVNSRGEQVFDVSAGALTLNGPLKLEAGDYVITLTHDNDSAEFLTVSVDILIRYPPGYLVSVIRFCHNIPH